MVAARPSGAHEPAPADPTSRHVSGDCARETLPVASWTAGRRSVMAPPGDPDQLTAAAVGKLAGDGVRHRSVRRRWRVPRTDGEHVVPKLRFGFDTSRPGSCRASTTGCAKRRRRRSAARPAVPVGTARGTARGRWPSPAGRSGRVRGGSRAGRGTSHVTGAPGTGGGQPAPGCRAAHPGSRTPSMTWMTPLLASTSVCTTSTSLPAASVRVTAPSSPTLTVNVAR